MSLAGWNINNVLELTIDHTKVEEDLTDFPVCITLSSGTGINSFDATPVFDELTTSEVDSYTKLLLHMDDVLLSDSSYNPYTTTLVDGVVRSLTQSKFGGYSAYFDGTGDYITVPASIDWNFDSNFTIDFWLYNSSGNNKTLIKSVSNEDWNSASTGDYVLALGTDMRLTFYMKDIGNVGAVGTALSNSTWYHVAIVRSGSTIKLYRNGSADGNVGTSSAVFGNTNIFKIGGLIQTNLTTGSLNGYIDELRVSKGIARWTSNFTPPAGPYGSSWDNRKKIAITDSYDNQLYVEIELWNYLDEQAVLWTKVPTISSGTDTVLYLYYDATVSENTTYVGDITDVAAQSVWDDNFVGVWHMAQDPVGDVSGAIKDSTTAANHGTPVGSMTSADLVDGLVGKAIDFDGNNDYIDLLSESQIIPSNADFTIEVFANPTSGYFFGGGGDTGDTWSIQMSSWIFYFVAGGNLVTVDITGGSALHHFVCTRNGSLFTGYVDSVEEAASTRAGELRGASGGYVQRTIIGSNWKNGAIDDPVTGIIDEVRISKIARPAAWIKATYYSNFNNLITFDEYIPPPPPPVPPDVSNVWANDNFIFKTTTSGVGVYDILSGNLLGVVGYNYLCVGSVWANNDYLYIGTTDSGVLYSPMSSISGAVYNDLNIYKNYPDINNEYINYIHGNGNYLCVATASGVNIIDMVTSSGVYTNSSIIAYKCHQLADRTSYYIYDDKLMTVYDNDSTYLYTAGGGIIPTVSGINDLYIVDSVNNLILLATTSGAVVIEENKGNEVNSRFKYYYKEI